MPYKILALIAAGLVLLMLATMHPRYDVLLRIVVSGVAIWGAFVAVGEGRTLWAVALGLLAVVFNPFYVFPIGATAWAALSVVGATVLVASSTRVGALLDEADAQA